MNLLLIVMLLILALLIGGYVWRHANRLWSALIRQRPPWLKKYYRKRVLEKEDFHALNFLGLYEHKAIPDLLEILKKYPLAEDLAEFDEGKYQIMWRMDRTAPRRIAYFNRFEKYCRTLAVIAVLARLQHPDVLPLLERIAMSSWKRNDEATWALEYFGQRGFEVLCRIVAQKKPALIYALPSLAHFPDQALEPLSQALAEERKAPSSALVFSEIVLSLAACGQKALPILLNLKTETRGQTESLAENSRYFITLLALARLRYEPILEEARQLLGKTQPLQGELTAYYFLQKFSPATVFTLPRFDEAPTIRILALALLKHYFPAGRQILRAQLRQEPSPPTRKYIKQLMKSAGRNFGD